MSPPLSLTNLLTDMADFMAPVLLGAARPIPGEIEAVRMMAKSACDYLGGTLSGGPPGSGQTLAWVLYSALWEGRVEQGEVDEFFSKVNVDISRLFGAWRQMKAENPGGRYTVAILPGDLSNADITKVAEALFLNRGPGADAQNEIDESRLPRQKPGRARKG